MTAVTVDKTYDNVPLMERSWFLDINEAYTWVCPMGKPIYAQMTIVENIDAYVCYTLSGRTFTFHESGGSGVKVIITVSGKL